jgi:hypothetical protein
MGPKYVVFRIWYNFQKRVGYLKKRFPVNQTLIEIISLDEWRKSADTFFVKDRERQNFPKKKDEKLKYDALQILSGNLEFFNSTTFKLGLDYDWLTNPDTGFKYKNTKHWTEFSDYSKEAGDIKYVWEKSRFSYLNTIIRYDYHFEIDQSSFVFSEIENWINNNPVNMGPNYICSQEITIRCFNWIIALYYYKNSKNLTQSRFTKILNSLYLQANHVYENINFSKISVRNNHAITECLGIYTFGILFPYFPNAKKWKTKGKKWFESEIAYQIYDDGTFLQFSMNYHRVVIQLLTWAIQINKINDQPFKSIVYDKASKSLSFLMSCMNPSSGFLPNYGANDGALFFKFNTQQFRDFRPQLESLSLSLDLYWPYSSSEDKFWFGLNSLPKTINHSGVSTLKSFKNGGYYLINDIDQTFTFIRCGNHKDRPSQADNLHLDIWIDGENVLRDAGSFKYNTNENDLKYFFGTQSHNCSTLGESDQMLKGGRFIWYNWTQSLGAELIANENEYVFTGKISAFKHIDNKATHKRTVIKKRGIRQWEILDELSHSTNKEMFQYWHPTNEFLKKFKIIATTIDGMEICPIIEQGYYSSLYGKKEEAVQIKFKTEYSKILTIIKEK